MRDNQAEIETYKLQTQKTEQEFLIPLSASESENLIDKYVFEGITIFYSLNMEYEVQLIFTLYTNVKSIIYII